MSDLSGLEDWKKTHAGFDYADPSPIRERIRSKGYAASPEDVDILNAIVLWKINRQIELDFETIEHLNTIASSVATPEQALAHKDVTWLVERLIGSKGVGLPVASAILKQYCTQAFPIIDQRAFFTLHRQRLSLNAGADTYLEYIKDCADIASRYGIPFEKVDEVLYQLDKESGRTLNTVDEPKNRADD